MPETSHIDTGQPATTAVASAGADTMRAAVMRTFDGPDALTIEEVPAPVAGEGQVLVDLHYAGVSYPDLLQTRGLHQDRPELPFIPGWEASGVVVDDAGGFRTGDRVAVLTLFGGFAERVAVPAPLVLPVPDDVGLDVAAALPLNHLTAAFGLLHRGGLREGDAVLVHGASGGVGTAACQIAHAHGCQVIAVVSTPDKFDGARAAGADEVIPVEGFKDAARELTGGRGVDLVWDPVGGDRVTDSLRSLAVDGRLLVVGFTGGDIPTVKLNRLLLGNIGVLGVNLSTPLRRRPQVAREMWDGLLPLVSSGQATPVLGDVRPLDEARDALVALDERRVVGKQLLRIHPGL